MSAQPLRVGSLFSGIGGFDLGFERAGMRTAWFVENNDFCRRVLAKHWPGVPIHGDIKECGAGLLGPVDVLCGGFPCQDLSAAGKGAGLDGAHSGLWSEFGRLVGELRPRYVVVENVPMLRSRGLGRVLGEMAALGYDAEWDCIPAQAVGAPHRWDRIWIVAYPKCAGLERQRPVAGEPEIAKSRNGRPPPLRGIGRSAYWQAEPNMGRVANGVPDRVDRLTALGNALVPQIAELIGSRIVANEQGEP